MSTVSEKDQLKNNIIIRMKAHVDSNTLTILEHVLVKELHGIEIQRMETLPSTEVDSNQYIRDLFDARKAPKISEKSADNYRNQIKDLIEYTGKSLLHINDMDVESYLLDYAGRGNSLTTVNNARRFISAFFTWMRKSHLILCNPCDNVEVRKEIHKPIEHMTAEEMEIVRNGCKTKRDRALVEFLRSTAVRVGEIPQIRICDISWGKELGTISILGHKTGKYRTVCLDSVAEHYILEYLKDRNESTVSNEPLFARHRENKPIMESGIYSRIKKIAANSGIEKNVYPHLFRKTTATNIIRRGGSDDAAGEYLGHTPEGVTGRHYTYKGDDHILEIFKHYVAAV